jgi:hypothetical protein
MSWLISFIGQSVGCTVSLWPARTMRTVDAGACGGEVAGPAPHCRRRPQGERERTARLRAGDDLGLRRVELQRGRLADGALGIGAAESTAFWSIASTLMLVRMVRLRPPPSPPVWRTSTRSLGRMKPPAELSADTRTATARMPDFSMAAR